MFDSFHHAADPAALVRRLGQATSRFLLVEPHGDWKGGWRREIDCDWMVLELEKIRLRAARLLGETQAPQPPAGDPGPAPAGEPIENRYSLDDFSRFFDGYTLDVRGTVSGLDVYPSNPHIVCPTREWFVQLGYDALTRMDEALRGQDLDLLAKHWVIYCERGGKGVLRRPPRADANIRADDVGSTQAGTGGPSVQGPYDAEYSAYGGPREVRAGGDAMATVCVRNNSWRTWSSQASPPILLSYHWLSSGGTVQMFDGPRSPLPRELAPGDECVVALRVRAPDRAGRYVLAVDLVEEGTSWFSDAGVACLHIPVRIRRP